MEDKLMENAIKINNYENLNQNKFLYFWDKNLNMYAIEKDNKNRININELNYYLMEDNYYDSFSKLFFNYMFFNESLDISSFSFFVLDLINLSYEDADDIIILIKEAIGRISVLRLRGKTIIFYFSKEKFNLKSIIDTINDDFAVSLKVFEGCRINHKEDFFIIFDLYFEYLETLSHHYNSISDLILKVQELDHIKLKIMRPIVLGDILNDHQLINLINSLFKNNLNVTQTASAVYMHRNTINNKIEYIKNETGINIQNFIEAVAMYLLIKSK